MKNILERTAKGNANGEFKDFADEILDVLGFGDLIRLEPLQDQVEELLIDGLVHDSLD